MLAGVLIAIPAAPWAQDSASGRLSAVLFSGLEVEPYSAFFSAGGKLSLPMADQSRIFVLGASGASLSDLRRLREGKLSRGAVAAEARLLLGLERSFGPLFISAGLGPSAAQYLSPQGRTTRRAGIAMAVDGWYRPDETQSLHAAAMADTSQRAFWMRLRYGIRPAALPAYFGPEISYGLSRGARKFKFGLHASEYRLGMAVLTLAAGAMWDRGRPGGYLTLSGYTNF